MKRLFLQLEIVFGLVCLFSVLPASAANLGDSVQLHGFGGWAYGQTDGSDYLTGTDDGDYSHTELFLNLYSQPTENLAVFAQVGWSQGDQGSEAIFDYAFAEWTFSDAAKARVGRVKHPFGLYGEIQRVGTLRPFLNLAQSVYGPTGFVGLGYNGAGLTGRVFTDSGWSLGYDVYGGQLGFDFDVPSLYLGLAQLFLGADPGSFDDSVIAFDVEVSDVLGGRLDVTTPIQGLRFGASLYTGKTDDNLSGIGDRKQYGLHAEYLWQGLALRGEWTRQNQTLDSASTFDAEIDGAYLEAAWRFTDHWQVAARYDWYDIGFPNFDESVMPKYFQSFLTHKDTSIGLNYWFNNNFVLKLSYHQVEGIRFASPTFDDALDVILNGNFADEADLIQFGGQFSF